MSEHSSELLIAAEVARWLRVGCSTVYLWAILGKIPCVKLNGAIRFVRSDIDRWIHDRTRIPADTAPVVTRPILSPNPTAVSRVMIRRAGARAIRHVTARQLLHGRSKNGFPLPSVEIGKRKGKR